MGKTAPYLASGDQPICDQIRSKILRRCRRIQNWRVVFNNLNNPRGFTTKSPRASLIRGRPGDTPASNKNCPRITYFSKRSVIPRTQLTAWCSPRNPATGYKSGQAFHMRLPQLTFPRALGSTFGWFTRSNRMRGGLETHHQVAIYTDCATISLKNSRADVISGSSAKRRRPISFLSQHSCLVAFFDCENAGAFPSVLFALLCENGLKLRVWFE
jgi:hypothetical protein